MVPLIQTSESVLNRIAAGLGLNGERDVFLDSVRSKTERNDGLEKRKTQSLNKAK